MLITLNPANNQWHAIVQITTSYRSTAAHPSRAICFPLSSPLCCRGSSVSVLTYLTVWPWAFPLFSSTGSWCLARHVIHKVIHRWYEYLNDVKDDISTPPPEPSVALNWPSLPPPAPSSPIISNSTFICVTIPRATCMISNPWASSYFTYTGFNYMLAKYLPFESAVVAEIMILI